jgi:hypothetical protein
MNYLTTLFQLQRKHRVECDGKIIMKYGFGKGSKGGVVMCFRALFILGSPWAEDLVIDWWIFCLLDNTLLTLSNRW